MTRKIGSDTESQQKGNTRANPKDSLPPNISLNTHRERNPLTLVVPSIIGVLLQGGVLVYSGMVAYYSSFTERHSILEEAIQKKYGFALQVIGTVVLTICMGWCARIIDHSTQETRWGITVGTLSILHHPTPRKANHLMSMAAIRPHLQGLRSGERCE